MLEVMFLDPTSELDPEDVGHQEFRGPGMLVSAHELFIDMVRFS